MTPEERATLDQMIHDWREEATEVIRIKNRTTERAEVLTELALQVERAFEAAPAPTVGDVPAGGELPIGDGA